VCGRHRKEKLVRLAEYCDKRVRLCVYVFVCPRAYLWKYKCDLRQCFSASYKWPWLCAPRNAAISTLCTSGFTDDAIFADHGPYRRMSTSLQRVSLLRRGERPWHWLRRVLDAGAPRLNESIVQGMPAAGGGACNAPLPCLVLQQEDRLHGVCYVATVIYRVGQKSGATDS